MNDAIVVIGYNRPSYYERIIRCLEKNPESQTLPFFLFCDGGDPLQSDIISIAKTAKIKEKQIIASNKNFGCGKHLIFAREVIFDKLKFDRAIIFEDDLEVTPQYISLVFNMMTYTAQFDDVGICQAYRRDFDITKEQAEEKANVILSANENFWGYGINRNTWNGCKDFLFEYRDRFLNINSYAERDNDAIHNWFMESNVVQKTTTSPLFENSYFIFDETPLKEWPTGQDAATSIALRRVGKTRVTTLIPRSHYIGARGIHCTEELYDLRRFADSLAWEFTEDSTRTEFLVENRKVSG